MRDDIVHKPQIPAGALISSGTIALLCLALYSFSVESSVVKMEIVERSTGDYEGVVRVHEPDSIAANRAFAEALRSGKGIPDNLKDFDSDLRVDARILITRIYVARLFPITEQLDVELEISKSNADGTRSVRRYDADSKREMNELDAGVLNAAIPELDELGYTRAATLLRTGSYAEPTKLMPHGVIVILVALVLPLVVAMLHSRLRVRHDVTSTNSTTPLPSPTTPEDPQT